MGIRRLDHRWNIIKCISIFRKDVDLLKNVIQIGDSPRRKITLFRTVIL